MAPSLDYNSLSREERLRRIGALLCKATSLSLMRDKRSHESASPGCEPIDQTLFAVRESPEQDELNLLQHFARFGEFSPKEALEFLNISRTSVYRKLLRLESAGWIVRQGKTTATRYVIADRLKQVKRTVQSLETESSPEAPPSVPAK